MVLDYFATTAASLSSRGDPHFIKSYRREMRTSESRDSTSSVVVPNVELLVETRGEGAGRVHVVSVLNDFSSDKGTYENEMSVQLASSSYI